MYVGDWMNGCMQEAFIFSQCSAVMHAWPSLYVMWHCYSSTIAAASDITSVYVILTSFNNRKALSLTYRCRSFAGRIWNKKAGKVGSVPFLFLLGVFGMVVVVVGMLMMRMVIIAFTPAVPHTHSFIQFPIRNSSAVAAWEERWKEEKKTCTSCVTIIIMKNTKCFHSLRKWTIMHVGVFRLNFYGSFSFILLVWCSPERE